MDQNTIDALMKKAEEIRGRVWDDGLLRTTGPGGSYNTRNKKFHHSLAETAHYFALGKFTGNIDTDMGTNILIALENCQVKDEGNELFGAFSRYAEDDHPQDSSEVFAVVAPLETVKVAGYQTLSLGEVAIIDRILERAENLLGM